MQQQLQTSMTMEQLHMIQKDGKCGFADEQGKVVIPCTWKEAAEFREGLAPVCNDEDKWGYIDMEGNIVIPCEWRDANLFGSGFAEVYSYNDNYFSYYIDTKGNVICSSVYSYQAVTKIIESIKLSEQGRFNEAIELVYSVLYPMYDEDATPLRLLIQYSLVSKQSETMVKVLESLTPLMGCGMEYDVQYTIGKLYKDGIGVNQDYKKSYEWFRGASCSKNDDIAKQAKEAMDELLNEHPEIQEQ